MARKQPNPTSETLRDLEESGDRVAEWASENAAKILGVIAGLLVLAGAVGLYVQHNEQKVDDGANALALATSQYRQAMGADPVGGVIPEPANPALAERTREQYIKRFSEVAKAHAGTTAGAVAWLEAGHLQSELGRLEAAAESFGNSRKEGGRGAIAALGSIRLAGLAEGRDDPATAARAYVEAASVKAYPLRAEALAEAVRCWIEAGETDQAIATFQRIENEFPDYTVAAPIASRIAELRITQ